MIPTANRTAIHTANSDSDSSSESSRDPSFRESGAENRGSRSRGRGRGRRVRAPINKSAASTVNFAPRGRGRPKKINQAAASSVTARESTEQNPVNRIKGGECCQFFYVEFDFVFAQSTKELTSRISLSPKRVSLRTFAGTQLKAVHIMPTA